MKIFGVIALIQDIQLAINRKNNITAGHCLEGSNPDKTLLPVVGRRDLPR